MVNKRVRLGIGRYGKFVRNCFCLTTTLWITQPYGVTTSIWAQYRKFPKGSSSGLGLEFMVCRLYTGPEEELTEILFSAPKAAVLPV